MLDIEEYILLPKDKRQDHLILSEACLERGGPKNGGLSAYCKGLMAHFLDTTIPIGHKIHVCHACNNERCSNPKHMYWGTAKENRNDQIKNGTSKSIFQRMVEKYGYEEACKKNSRKGNNFGTGNKGKPKTKGHREKIADSVKLAHNNKKGG